MSVCDKNTARVNNSQFPSWHLSFEWKWMGKWPALYRPSCGRVTGWMMQIADNISPILNGITPNLMSLKWWVLALLSGGGGVGRSGLTDTQIKCSDREHNKVIRECDMSVRGDEGMNCHSLSEPILSLIHDVPYTTVGKQDSPALRQIFIQVEDKYTHSSFPVHCTFANVLPEEKWIMD